MKVEAHREKPKKAIEASPITIALDADEACKLLLLCNFGMDDNLTVALRRLREARHPVCDMIKESLGLGDSLSNVHAFRYKLWEAIVNAMTEAT